jgi:hypothetical protein
MTDTTPDHLTPTVTDRGFTHLPPIHGTYNDWILAYESSAADGPHIWVSVNPDGPAVHLPAENAIKLAEQLLFLAQNHYQGPIDVQQILTLASRPIPQEAACEHCGGTATVHESWCQRGR